MRLLFTLILAILAILATMSIRRYLRKRYYNVWFPSYLKFAFSSSEVTDATTTKHIVFLVCDHFEPGPRDDFLREWLDRYHEVVVKHHDSFGNHPKRTLHYPIEQFRDSQIEMMLPMCRAGIAEIELHLHHLNDTSESVTKKYVEGLEKFARYGICQTIDDPALTRFAFVHGDWALDNGCSEWNPNPCGVNDEIQILKSLGCFIDCTFPALWSPAQPRQINSIYYATDDPNRPKSYDHGVTVRHRGKPSGDLLMLQGPLLIDWFDWRYRSHPTIEHGDISAASPLYEDRVRLWLQANVHVAGKPDWVFVKLHSHGCHRADWPQVLGDPFDNILSTLENRYNDGKRHVLHYVTAREAYNMIKAAEAGETGNPEDYRNYIIKPYRANQPR